MNINLAAASASSEPRDLVCHQTLQKKVFRNTAHKLENLVKLETFVDVCFLVEAASSSGGTRETKQIAERATTC